MGKKSKKKKKVTSKNNSGSSAAAVAAASAASPTSGGRRELRIDWEMIPPEGERVVLETLASPNSLRSKLQSLESSGTWSVSIRRARLWFERDKVAKKGIEPKYRTWYFSVMMGRFDRCKVYTVMVEDDKAIEKDTRKLPFTGKHFLAALHMIMKHSNTKPSNVVLWPNVGFRISSVQSLLDELSHRREENKLLPWIKMLPCHEPSMPLSDCNHAVEIHQADENDFECKLFKMLEVGSDGLIPAVETHLERVDSMQGLDKAHRSAYIPSLTENVVVNRVDLRRLFAVCKAFHEKRPWETIGEKYPLQVTVPDLYRIRQGGASTCDDEDAPTRTYFCMVSGFGSWDARGIHMYGSWNDLRNYVNDNAIMYFCRTWTPYRTLDHVEELGLDLAKNDGRDGEASYPWLFFNKSMPVTEEDALELGKLSPETKDIPSLILAIAAATTYVDRFCKLLDDNRLSTPAHPVQVDLNHVLADDDEELSRLQCRTTAQVICRLNHDAPKYADGDLTSNKYMETMSVGSEKVCNFCQKPERILKKELGERLLSCSRCKSIHYCSKRCQASDWSRHKRSCVRK